MVELTIRLICLVCSIFAISGLDINHIFKKNHIWEARIFILSIIFALAYLSSSFIIAFLIFK